MTKLSAVQQKFILHWGEMGARWGINRTVAQIHALLYLAPKPLNAEEIATLLSIARSNVSTSLHELLDWGLVRSSHVLGDRREIFEAEKDVWQMLQIIVDERKKREVDPTLSVLKSCAVELQNVNGAENAYTRERIGEMLSFFETTTSLYDDLKRVPSGALRHLIKMKGKIRKLLAGTT
ncbi:MAG: MarR family transcriptional regulator [Bryobacteraceae bacterium]|jgi:DNA-binding transcriptional regulator GbsR (MarR family)